MLDAYDTLRNLPILIILGVGRSGTNLLADIVDAEPRYHNTVENRYIWNYRQKDLSCDFRDASDATAPVSEFICSQFDRQARHHGAIPVDKSPSNVFRVPFINAVFPNARFLHIIRDGRSNVYSRMREWKGGKGLVASQEQDGSVKLQNGYRTNFVRQRVNRALDLVRSGSLPPSQIPVFLRDNISPFLSQLTSGRANRYGERFPGISSHLKTYGVAPTAGAQWREGTMQALVAGRRLPVDRYREVRYESLLGAPEETWAGLADFLGVEADGPGMTYIKATLRPNSAPDWSDERYTAFLDEVEPFIRATCEFLGYPWRDAPPSRHGGGRNTGKQAGYV